ncbi:DNA-directed RNA polymerase III subunit RPC2 [Nematocida sp. LUAm3]|nr:DNA-directed RNA polymerase III subunit RPC2 [Nematocida sp. LUAm3]KAI5176217.1 DNA-directed RNA polymerase III subunit RPC2 [Nematocida sp. LUAm2]KAI5179205.1 DNA-directed RNA polymerase III subunit RPC2 [Nematocida sp. LUAm1]
MEEEQDRVPLSYFTKKCLEEKGINRHHIDSFDRFIKEDLKRILSVNNFIDSDVDPSFYLKYVDIRVDPPSIEENMVKRSITPEECRIRNLSYTGDVVVDVEYVRGKDIITAKGITIGRIPIMIGSFLSLKKPKFTQKTTFPPENNISLIISPKCRRPEGECPYDSGGYFICKGVERVLLMQEQLAKNRILIEIDYKGDLCAVVTSSSLERKSKTKLVLKKKLIYLSHNSLSEDLPLQIILKGMGIVTDLEIEALLGHFLPPVERIRTQLEALSLIGSKIKTRAGGIDEARIFLHDIILAHIPCTPINMIEKAEYLSVMANMLANHKGDSSTQNDKDFVGNKRIEQVGPMLSLLFEDLLKRFNSEIKKSLDRVLCKKARAQELDALHFLVMNRSIISTGVLKAISSGNWSLKRFRMDRAGVTQPLSRLSRLSAIGMCSRVSSQFEKTRKVSGPRALHCSQWGLFCPADTPEGEACGLVKSLATLTEISPLEEEEKLIKVLSFLGVEDLLGILSQAPGRKCWINGRIIGYTKNPSETAKKLREFRRNKKIPLYTGIWISNDLYISTEPGRILRPLIIVEQGSPKVSEKEMRTLKNGYRTLDQFRTHGLIEYIDQNEAMNTNIAVWRDEIHKDTTHLEIDPSSILGYVAGVIPFPHHNQSPRNTYQCAMGKQAVGVTGIDLRKRVDGANFLLCHPQRPLASTRAIEAIKYNELPAGQNLIIGVMSISGYDIEDAIVLNRAAVDRGVGRAFLYKTHSLSLRIYPGGGADTIAQDGIPSPGKRVQEGEPFINRKDPLGGKAAAVYRGLDPAVVDRTILTRTGDDLITIKSVLRENRIPQVGDKFSSRHGQKGVIGLILPQEDMPFNEEGISPDLIMNPHGFPSRMTVGKVLELVTGKARALGSKRIDEYAASIFGGVQAKDISEELIALGYSSSGKEMLTCGVTGKRIPVTIFFGPVFYQRLKHMVSDKMHARARGPRAVLTRQPTEGRCRDGGFRLGEMERDCLIGYGASEILIERLVISSDKYMIYICLSCGLPVHTAECHSCRSTAQKMQIPYACKLLFQELMAMNIAPRITLRSE